MAIASHSSPASQSLAGRMAGAALWFLVMGSIIALYTLSGGVLWKLGINYDGVQGNPATKLHPSFYLMVIAFTLYYVTRPDPYGALRYVLDTNRGAVLLAFVALLTLVHTVTSKLPGLTIPFDTYLLPVMMAILLLRQDEAFKARAEQVIHVLMCANALFGLLEFAIGHRFFPAVNDGVAFEFDTRSAGFLGHPLMNATITGTYVMALMAGGSRLGFTAKGAILVLQFLGMVAFGGRTALVLCLAFAGFFAMIGTYRAIFSRGIPILYVAILFLAIPVAAVTVVGLVMSGFFDSLMERFTNDGGSARARILMFELVDAMTWRDLLVGPDSERLYSLQYARGLELGIENPLIRIMLRQGLLIMIALTIGIIYFIHDEFRRLRPGRYWVLVFFFVTAMSFESLSSKTILFVQFMVINWIMFRPLTTNASGGQAAVMAASWASASSAPLARGVAPRSATVRVAPRGPAR
jgi:hypothetical protein